MHETSHPLRFTVTVTVPIVCRVSNDCNVIVRIKQDNSEIYLSLCSMRFHNRTASHVFDLAVKRDFIYGRNKQTRVKLLVQNQTDPIDFIDHHDIPEIVVSTKTSCWSFAEISFAMFTQNPNSLVRCNMNCHISCK